MSRERDLRSWARPSRESWAHLKEVAGVSRKMDSGLAGQSSRESGAPLKEVAGVSREMDSGLAGRSSKQSGAPLKEEAEISREENLALAMRQASLFLTEVNSYRTTIESHQSILDNELRTLHLCIKVKESIQKVMDHPSSRNATLEALTVLENIRTLLSNTLEGMSRGMILFDTTVGTRFDRRGEIFLDMKSPNFPLLDSDNRDRSKIEELDQAKLALLSTQEKYMRSINLLRKCLKSNREELLSLYSRLETIKDKLIEQDQHLLIVHACPSNPHLMHEEQAVTLSSSPATLLPTGIPNTTGDLSDLVKDNTDLKTLSTDLKTLSTNLKELEEKQNTLREDRKKLEAPPSTLKARELEQLWYLHEKNKLEAGEELLNTQEVTLKNGILKNLHLIVVQMNRELTNLYLPRNKQDLGTTLQDLGATLQDLQKKKQVKPSTQKIDEDGPQGKKVLEAPQATKSIDPYTQLENVAKEQVFSYPGKSLSTS